MSNIPLKSRFHIKVLLLVAILLYIPNSIGCDQKLNILFGPFFSHSFVTEYFSSIHARISDQTGCDVTVHISESYGEYHNKIKSFEYAIIVLPTPHLPYVKSFGFEFAASGFGSIEFVLVSPKTSNILKIADLKNKTLLLNGDISYPAILWRELAKASDFKGPINIDYRGNTDQLLIRVLKKDADATITLRRIVERLPSNLKRNLSVLGSKTFETPGSIVFKVNLSPMVKKSIRNAYNEHPSWSNNLPDPNTKADSYTKKHLSNIFNSNKKLN